eukprot:NODE_633_length_5774_cov_0.180617.p2 type:complete len:402 gc:universal NODE_633_length_5774_cov_0.180617:143-1348(+)
MQTDLSELQFDSNNMIWWTVESELISESRIMEHFEEEVLYYSGSLQKVSEDTIIILQNFTVNEIEDALLKTREHRVLVISKLTLSTFQSVCLTQFLAWYTPIFVDSTCKISSFTYYLESFFFSSVSVKWLPSISIMSYYDHVIKQYDSLVYFSNMNRYVDLFISHSEIFNSVNDSKLQAQMWQELSNLSSYKSLDKFTSKSKFLEFFQATIRNQRINFKKVSDTVILIYKQYISNGSADIRFQFITVCTDIEQVRIFQSKVKNAKLIGHLGVLIDALEKLYSLPFHELFIFDDLQVLKRTVHVNIIDVLKHDLNNQVEFATQFDKSNYCYLFDELFKTLKEMPMDSNLYDSMVSFCTKCNLKQNGETRLQFEMLIRDFENIGIVNLTAKKDHVQKNLLYFT